MKKAFTLAEVLVTLSIVGVVAILTVPSALKSYKHKVYSASLKKAYGQISDAAKAIMQDEQSNSFYQTTAAVPSNCSTEGKEKGGCYFLKNYFKIAKDCIGSTPSKCVASSYTSTAGDNAGVVYGECIRTINGAGICYTFYSEGTLTPYGTSHFIIDTNGPEQPNMTGVDAFVFSVKEDGSIIDFTDNADLCNVKSMDEGHIADYASGCFTKVVQNGWKIED